MCGSRLQRHAFTLRTFLVAALLTVVTSALGLLTTASKVDGKYPYNSATVPFFAEILKFSISAHLLQQQSSHAQSRNEEPPRTMKSAKGLALFLFPSVLYWVHNNLQFYTLKYVDPATYQVLGNLKIATTAVLFTLLLRQPLPMLRWIAILLLIAGTTTSQLNISCNGKSLFSSPLVGYVLAMMSAWLSGFGAVYTEWVLKRNSDSLYWQNMQLYGLGVCFNFLGLAFGANNANAGSGLQNWWNLVQGYSLLTWLIVLNLALSGLLVSWLMKFGDSILKVYATSLAMLLSMMMSVWFFYFQVTLQMLLGVLVATLSVCLYYLPPEKLHATAADHANEGVLPKGKTSV